MPLTLADFLAVESTLGRLLRFPREVDPDAPRYVVRAEQHGRRELFVAPLTTISSVMAYHGRLYAKAGATTGRPRRGHHASGPELRLPGERSLR